MDVQRRTLLALPLGLAAAGLCAGRSHAAELPYGGELRFAVHREGERIGSHVVRFRKDGPRLITEIAVDLRIWIAFIPVFRYAHRNREVWEDGRLVEMDSTTDDNGRDMKVSVRRNDLGLLVNGMEPPYLAPRDRLPTTYWHPDTVRQGVLLNSQNGHDEPIEPTDRGPDVVRVAGQDVAARHWHLAARVNIDAWYADGEWVKLAFTARGSRIEYERETPMPSGAASRPRSTG